MIISHRQMEVFSQNHRRTGNLRIAEYIDARFPGLLETRDAEERIAIVEKYRRLAAEWKLFDDDQIGYYMDLTVMYGASFPQIPALHAILSADALAPTEKIARIKFLLQQNGVVL